MNKRKNNILVMSMAAVSTVAIMVALSGCTKNMDDIEPVSPGKLEIRIATSNDTNDNQFAGQPYMSSRTSQPIVTYGEDGSVSAIIPSARRTSDSFGGPQTLADGDLDENHIDCITILVFNSDGMVLENMLFVDMNAGNIDNEQPKWNTRRTLIVDGIKEPSKSKNIYVIANHKLDIDDLSNYNALMLRQELVNHAPYPEPNRHGFLMSGYTTQVDLASLNYRVSVPIERQLSKIETKFTISKQTQERNPNITWETNDLRFHFVHSPAQSRIIRPLTVDFPSISLWNENVYRADDLKPPHSDPDPKVDLVWNETTYLCESEISSNTTSDKSSYMIIQLPYTDRKTGITEHDNYYMVYIKNGGTYGVERNMHYMMDINILGPGSPIDGLQSEGNITASLSVEKWNVGAYGVMDEKESYVNINRTRIEYQLMDSAVQRIFISSNITDWTLHLENGRILSRASAPDLVQLDGFMYELPIIPPGENQYLIIRKEDNADPATIQTHEFRFKNLRIPLVVSIDNGLILNDVLEQPFKLTIDAVSIDGYPKDRLRPRGIQVAKMGNVLPSRRALPTERGKQWSTEKINTHVMEDRCGMGKSNTAELLRLEPTRYPAVNMCQELGPDWYLPSRDEILLLFVHNNLLGRSYSLLTEGGGYWSSTQYGNDIDLAWGVWRTEFSITSGYSKYDFGIIRCIKNI